MNKAIGFALLAAGIALIIYGAQSSNSAASNISNFFTGSPTNKTLWLLIGGIASTVLGGVMLFFPSRRA